MNKLTIILALVLLLFSNKTVYAQSANREPASTRALIAAGVGYFNTQEAASCNADGVSTGGAAVDPAENAEAVWRFYADRLPAHIIAGIIGNMHHESGVQPQRYEGTASGVVTTASRALELVEENTLRHEQTGLYQPLGWGIVQWTPATKMISTFSNVEDANVLENQLTFLWEQLEGRTSSPEGAAGASLRAARTIEEATRIFGAEYERPSDLSASITDRIAAAEAANRRFEDTIPTVAAPVSTATTAPTSPSAAPASGSGGACANTIPASGSEVVDIAQAELSLGPVEYDENVLKYTDGNEEAWCADFVSWVFNEAELPFQGGVSEGGWRIPGVINLQEMFQDSENGNVEYFAVGEQEPQPGDVAFYIGEQTPDGGSNEHVNIVIQVNGDTMTTIGGNESNSVRQSQQSISANTQNLVGFGRVVSR